MRDQAKDGAGNEVGVSFAPPKPDTGLVGEELDAVAGFRLLRDQGEVMARALGAALGRTLLGRRALVVGRSPLVGRPVADLLLRADCTVTVAHSKTRDLPAVCRGADILVVAAGRPAMVRGSWIKPGAAVIDVGVNRVPFRDPVKAAAGKTKVVGDVAFAEALEVAGWITPVPGGVGLMTVACLLSNTVEAARRLHGLQA